MTGRLERCIKEAKKVGLKGKSVLDVGCSDGWFCGIALKNGARKVLGLDPNEKQLNIARSRYPKAEFLKSTAGDLPVKNSTIDVVTLLDVIEHIPEDTEPQTLAEIHRVLKRKGYLLISTPNDNILAKFSDPAWYFGHRHYSKSNLTKMLEQAGFKVISVNILGGMWEIIGMGVLYFSKWILRMKHMPFEHWIDVKRRKEFEKSGFTHLMITSQKV